MSRQTVSNHQQWLRSMVSAGIEGSPKITMYKIKYLRSNKIRFIEWQCCCLDKGQTSHKKWVLLLKERIFDMVFNLLKDKWPSLMCQTSMLTTEFTLSELDMGLSVGVDGPLLSFGSGSESRLSVYKFPNRLPLPISVT